MTTVNLGILAHVDAGKTTLTERLLHDAGVIDRVGRVDHGDTQTDSMDLERRRGITIRSAVVSFAVGDRTVNLIDTPGHGDFIAEVARAVRVLDGAVLVVSAVEGVQSQTRVLMRTLTRLRIPTLVFVNKIDRAGARDHELVADLRSLLHPGAVALSATSGLGTRDAVAHDRDPCDPALHGDVAEAVAEHDEEFVAAYLSGPAPSAEAVRAVVARQTTLGTVLPVYFGSAATGTGVAALAAGVAAYLPAAPETDGPVRATVFKVERGPGGRKIAYARSRGGVLRARQTVTVHRAGEDGRVSAYEARPSSVAVVRHGADATEGELRAGGIARITGVKGALIGDVIGEPGPGDLDGGELFGPPTLETAVRPRRPGDRRALYAALTELGERDPFIGVRPDVLGDDPVVSLYGEVQKEVVAALLAEEFGIPVTFSGTRTVHIEHVIGIGEAVETMAEAPFTAGLGFRVEPGPPGSGVGYRLGVERGALPHAFHTAIETTVRSALEAGLNGWRVRECAVTLIHSQYSSAGSVAADFRRLTPLVLMAALREAGTRVSEPCRRYELDVPARAVAAATRALAAAGAVPEEVDARGPVTRLSGRITVRGLPELTRRLPRLAGGEAVLMSEPDGYAPVAGRPPYRARNDGNPLDRAEYLRGVALR